MSLLSVQLAEALRGALGSAVELHVVVAGRPLTFRLTELCTEGAARDWQSMSPFPGLKMKVFKIIFHGNSLLCNDVE